MPNQNSVSAADVGRDRRYANHLQFLWEQYNKLMGLGVLASGLTLGFLLGWLRYCSSFRAGAVRF